MDVITGAFHGDILPELGGDATTSFIIAALRRFDVSPVSTVSITTDGNNYSNSMRNVSWSMMIRIRRQRYLFHVMKDLTKKAYGEGKLKDLRGSLDLINYMFFQTLESLEELGKNAESTGSIVSGLSEKEAALGYCNPSGTCTQVIPSYEIPENPQEEQKRGVLVP